MKSLTTSQAARGAWVLAGGAAVIVLAAGTASAATPDHAPDHHGRHLHLLQPGYLRHEAGYRLGYGRLQHRRLAERRLTRHLGYLHMHHHFHHSVPMRPEMR